VFHLVKKYRMKAPWSHPRKSKNLDVQIFLKNAEIWGEKNGIDVSERGKGNFNSDLKRI